MKIIQPEGVGQIEKATAQAIAAADKLEEASVHLTQFIRTGFARAQVIHGTCQIRVHYKLLMIVTRESSTEWTFHVYQELL